MGFNLKKMLTAPKGSRLNKMFTIRDHSIPGLALGLIGLGAAGYLGTGAKAAIGGAGKYIGGRLGLGSASGAMSGALSGPPGGKLLAAMPGAATSSGVLGGLGAGIGRTFSSANILKFLTSPTGKMLATNYLLPQIFPNPENSQIQSLIDQANKQREAALEGISGGRPYSSGGLESRYASALAGRGMGNSTMSTVSSSLLENARARANEDYNLRRASARSGIESDYLRNLYTIYDMKSASDQRYAAGLGALAELFG